MLASKILENGEELMSAFQRIGQRKRSVRDEDVKAKRSRVNAATIYT